MGMLMSINNIFLPEIDKKSCFECDSNEELHFHHPVPKSRGGTRTIPLCGICHAKAHHRKKNMSNSKLISDTYKRLKKIHGDKLNWGNKNIAKYSAKGIAAKRAQAEKHNNHIKELVSSIISKGKNLDDAVEHLNKIGVKTRTGKPYKYQNLWRVMNSTAANKKTSENG